MIQTREASTQDRSQSMPIWPTSGRKAFTKCFDIHRLMCKKESNKKIRDRYLCLVDKIHGV